MYFLLVCFFRSCGNDILLFLKLYQYIDYKGKPLSICISKNMHNFSNVQLSLWLINMERAESDENLFGTNLKSSIRMSLPREEIR